MIDKLKVHAHDKQQKFLRSRAKIKMFLAGRGSAKTHTIGYVVWLAFNMMPRAKICLAGLAYSIIDSVVIPVIIEALELMNVFQFNKTNPYGTYVIGVRPPEDWIKPYKRVGNQAYKYCITFINGFTIQMASQDIAESNRGLNIDGLLVDEAATVNEDFIYKILVKAIGRNKHNKNSDCYMYNCNYQFSSAAWYQSGFHIYKHEEAWKAQNLLRKDWTYEQKLKIPPKIMYLEATCLDNPLAGQEYWNAQKAVDDPLVFDIEVANMRLSHRPDGFYHAFSKSKHTYFQATSYDFDDEKGLFLYKSNDYREDKSLDVTLDFNADICWAVVIQEVGNESRIIRSNFIKPTISASDTDIVVQQAVWFAEQYKDHPKKEVFVYGDPNGNQKTAATSDNNRPHFERFTKVLRSAGWDVIRMDLLSYPTHKRKYSFLNGLLQEKSTRTPRIRINELTNKVLIIALQTTPVHSTKYTKVKTLESKKDTPTTQNREFAPDSTDAMDYYYWRKYGHLADDHQSQNNQIYIFRKK